MPFPRTKVQISKRSLFVLCARQASVSAIDLRGQAVLYSPDRPTIHPDLRPCNVGGALGRQKYGNIPEFFRTSIATGRNARCGCCSDICLAFFRSSRSYCVKFVDALRVNAARQEDVHGYTISCDFVGKCFRPPYNGRPDPVRKAQVAGSAARHRTMSA